MDLRSSYAQSLVELDSLTRVDMNDPNSIKESKMKSIKQVIHHFRLKKLNYYDDSQLNSNYYYDAKTRYIWVLKIDIDPLKMPSLVKVTHSDGFQILVNDGTSSPDGYDEYVKIMEFNGYKDNILTPREFSKQYASLDYSSENVLDLASGFNKTNKDFDYDSFTPELEMPNLNAETPECCKKPFMMVDSKTNVSTCLSCKSEFKTDITYNCPFCNNKHSSINVNVNENGAGVYCSNCNEDMDYGRSFRIAKEVKCIKNSSNDSFVINNDVNYDEFDNKLNPPSYRGF